MSKEAPSTKVERKPFVLKNVRLSYPNLFTPRAMTGDDGNEKKPEYSASFILDKEEHAKVIKQIEAEAREIAIKKWGKVPGKFKLPTRDGATFKDDESGEIKDGYGEDKVAVNAKSLAKQHCVDRQKQPADEDTLYGGCYVNTVITLYPWKHPKNGYGVSANLGPVQFFRNGERFGGQVIDPDDVFEDLGADDDGDDDEPPAKSKKPPAKSKKPDPDDDDDDPTADL
jgi:hypothetical protein